MGQACLVQGTADKAHIVAGPAAAAGLGHSDGQMVRVIPAGEHRLHDLAYGGHGGEAGVIVHIFQPRVDGGAVVVIQNHHVVAVLFEHRPQQVKMNGAHLGGDDGPALFPHLLGEYRPMVAAADRGGVDALLPAQVHGGKQAADADAGGAQVVHLVDLQNGVQLAGPL